MTPRTEISGHQLNRFYGFDFKRPLASSETVFFKIRGRSAKDRWWHYHRLQSYFLRMRSKGRPHVPAQPEPSLYPGFSGIQHNSFWFSDRRRVPVTVTVPAPPEGEADGACNDIPHMQFTELYLAEGRAKIVTWVDAAFRRRIAELEATGLDAAVPRIKNLIGRPETWAETDWVDDFVADYFLGYFKPNANSGMWFTAITHLESWFDIFRCDILEDIPLNRYIYDFLYIAPEKMNTIFANTSYLKLRNFDMLSPCLQDQIREKIEAGAHLDLAFERWLIRELTGDATAEPPVLSVERIFGEEGAWDGPEQVYLHAMFFAAYVFGEHDFDRMLPLQKNYPSFQVVMLSCLRYPAYVYSDLPQLTVADAVRTMNVYRPQKIAYEVFH